MCCFLFCSGVSSVCVNVIFLCFSLTLLRVLLCFLCTKDWSLRNLDVMWLFASWLSLYRLAFCSSHWQLASPWVFTYCWKAGKPVLSRQHCEDELHEITFPICLEKKKKIRFLLNICHCLLKAFLGCKNTIPSQKIVCAMKNCWSIQKYNFWIFYDFKVHT